MNNSTCPVSAKALHASSCIHTTTKQDGAAVVMRWNQQQCNSRTRTNSHVHTDTQRPAVMCRQHHTTPSAQAQVCRALVHGVATKSVAWFTQTGNQWAISQSPSAEQSLSRAMPPFPSFVPLSQTERYTLSATQKMYAAAGNSKDQTRTTESVPSYTHGRSPNRDLYTTELQLARAHAGQDRSNAPSRRILVMLLLSRRELPSAATYAQTAIRRSQCTKKQH